ncbi:MAG: signal peptidase I [Tannerella sp.]|jgi:signal peptidase I|nr:signal peptidase I [Tannerella sp.]
MNGRRGRISREKFWKEVRWWGIILFFAAVLAIVLRVFLFSSFKVPSNSMFPTIEGGDYIFVNKQIPGPRIFPHFPKVRVDGKVITKRFKGIREIRRNDIIVFNFPYTNREKIDMDLNVNYIKRCVAIPGDTFYIENGIYKVRNSPGETLGYAEYQQEMSRKPDGEYREEYVFPHDSAHYCWTARDFGPLYVPKKDGRLQIDTINYLLYSNLIAYETDKSVTVSDGNIYLGDSLIREYTFRMNYYFMAGDYIFDSVDSRYWGLVPEDHIIGKSVIIWKSKDIETGKYRWRRFFRIL